MFSQLSKRSTRMLISGIFKQLRIFVVVPDVSSKFSKVGNVLSQMKCMMSVSVEIIFCWAWLIISIWENEPKLNDKLLPVKGHHRSIEEYKRDNSESVKQHARTVWASLVSSLELARYDLLAPPFHNVTTSSVWRRKLKRKVIFNSCLNL